MIDTAHTLSIDQAFHRFLPRSGTGGKARFRLSEAIRSETIELWGRLVGGAWFQVSPDFFEGHLIVGARQGPDGWHARLEMIRAVQDFYKTEWAVSAQKVDALLDEKVRAPGVSTHPGDTNAEACTRSFLTDLMREDPDNKTRHAKADLQQKCKHACGEISGEAFKQILAACIDETGATAYSKPGPRGPHTVPRRSK
jgi:hypothetical protein